MQNYHYIVLNEINSDNNNNINKVSPVAYFHSEQFYHVLERKMRSKNWEDDGKWLKLYYLVPMLIFW